MLLAFLGCYPAWKVKPRPVSGVAVRTPLEALGVEQDMAHGAGGNLELASLPAGHGAGGVVRARTSQDMARGADFPTLVLAGIPRCSWGTLI